MNRVVLAHGGAGSYDNKHHDGPQAAAEQGMAALERGGSVVDAVVAATVVLEDDPRFNAGTGSNLRFDGRTIEMDASLMDGATGAFGAVACLQDVANPIYVAQDVMATPHNLLAGAGATAYARTRGHGVANVLTPAARTKYDVLMERLRTEGIAPGWCDWDITELRSHWNYDADLAELIPPGDTVGAVARDGDHFAAALSTGGTICTLLGRVGDVPLPGCGLWAGSEGAVCVTGDGDHLARARLASRVESWLKAGRDAQDCVDHAIALFPEEVAVGLIVVEPGSHAGGSNLEMAWAAVTA